MQRHRHAPAPAALTRPQLPPHSSAPLQYTLGPARMHVCVKHTTPSPPSNHCGSRFQPPDPPSAARVRAAGVQATVSCPADPAAPAPPPARTARATSAASGGLPGAARQQQPPPFPAPWARQGDGDGSSPTVHLELSPMGVVPLYRTKIKSSLCTHNCPSSQCMRPAPAARPAASRLPPSSRRHGGLVNLTRVMPSCPIRVASGSWRSRAPSGRRRASGLGTCWPPLFHPQTPSEETRPSSIIPWPPRHAMPNTKYIPWILVTQDFVSHRSMPPGLALLCDKPTSLQPGTDRLTHAKPKAHGLAREGRARLAAVL